MSSENGKNTKGRTLIRAIAFCCVIFLVVWVCSEIFSYTDAERSQKIMGEFYESEENTIDCVYFGSSATQRGWVVPVAYHEKGIASYSLASGSQPFMLTKYLMEEVQKTQNPELFIVELRGVAKTPDDIWDVAVRRMVDNMDMSLNKIQAIRDVTEYASHGNNSVDLTGLSYYFPLLKYHSRWNPSKQPHYGGVDYYKGYALEPTATFRVTTIKPVTYTEKTEPIAKETEKELKKLLDYCDSIDTDVLFVISPYEASRHGMQKIHYAKQLVEERGYECLDCLSLEKMKEIGLDTDTCYYNREHLNMKGSLIYTDYLAGYLCEHYGLKDRRNDGRHNGWEQEYQRLMKNLDGKYADLYQEMLEKTGTETGAETE